MAKPRNKQPTIESPRPMALAAAAPPPEVITITELITPESAKTYLLKNSNNRAVSQKVVNGYAEDMIAGKWKLTHQGIAFDADGVLIDGQHRLLAIVKANVAVMMLVTMGAAADTRLVCDSGRARTMGQSLHLHGVPHGQLVTGHTNTIRLLLTEIEGSFTRSEIMQGYEQFREAFGWITSTVGTHSYVRTAMVGAPFLLAYMTDPVKTAEAMGQFTSGANLAEDHPMFVLRKFWFEVRKREALRRDTAAKVLRCIYGAHNGEKMTTRHLLVAETVIDHFSRAFLHKNCIFTDAAIDRLAKAHPDTRPPGFWGKKDGG